MPIVIPLALNHASIVLMSSVLNCLAFGLRWVGKESPFPNEYLVTAAEMACCCFGLVGKHDRAYANAVKFLFLLGEANNSIDNNVGVRFVPGTLGLQHPPGSCVRGRGFPAHRARVDKLRQRQARHLRLQFPQSVGMR